ncbi:glycosyltransferase [Fodinicola feengrottensis]|uniref:Glycosyltransferase n=1 Tax=Fodinicola feengrottensis TaxID=435914 RepID=A0ABN2H5T2_9ACTN
MRILFASQPSYSHLVPLVIPAALAAVRAGHDVRVASGPVVTTEITSRGLEATVLPHSIPMGQLMADPQVRKKVGFAAAGSRPGKATTDLPPSMFAATFVGALGGPFAQDLLKVIDDWKPDLIVRESTEFGSYLAAERRGIAQAAIDITPMAPYADPAVLQEINEQRVALGLDPVDDPWHPMRNFRAGVVPEAFYRPETRLPHAHYYRPPVPSDDRPLDPAIAHLPSDRPLVLASLGSNITHFVGDDGPSILDTIVAALAKLPVTAVLALGTGRDPAQWQGARADNVHLTSFVQQNLMLPACDAFITHAGFSGTREALAAGVPMVTLPMFAEQPENAVRIAEIGAGTGFRLEDVTADSLRTAVEQVLTDPTYRSHARGLQRQMLALPPLEGFLTDL